MKIFLPILCLCLGSITGLSQSMQTEFGKNRVQFHNDFKEWSTYESTNFITYWYGEARNIGQGAVMIAEKNFQQVQNILEHQINDKIEIIVYTDLTDLKQSNIGSEDAFVNSSGQTKIVGNKMFVHYNGSYVDLERQIREGIASVYLNAMLFGSNLQEIVQNAVLLNLPVWFKEGLIAYVGKPWDTEADNQLRDLFRSKKYPTFEKMAEAHPELLGRAFWNHVATNYGKATVSHLLYLTRINRSIESGFLYVLGTSYGYMNGTFFKAYTDRYQKEATLLAAPEGTPLKIKNKRKLPLTQIKLSPNGKQIVYVTNEIGKYRVFVQDVDTGNRKLVHFGGFRNAFQATDYNYPLLAWAPSGQELSILYEHRDIPKLKRYDTTTKKSLTEDISTQYQRIYSIDYINNNELVLTGAVRGFSDVYQYFLNTRQSTRLTNDVWDDKDAVFVQINGKPGILFASNRPDTLLESTTKLDTVLPLANMDIFYLELGNPNGELVRITSTPFSNERNPMPVDTFWYAFNSDVSGIQNRFTGHLEEYVHHVDKTIYLPDGFKIVMHADSALTSKLDSATIAIIDSIVEQPILRWRSVNHPQTNVQANIHSQHKARRSNTIASSYSMDGQPKVYLHGINPEEENLPVATIFRLEEDALRKKKEEIPSSSLNQQLRKVVVPKPVAIDTLPVQKMDTTDVDIDNYLFQSEFDDEIVPTQKQEKPIAKNELPNLEIPTPNPREAVITKVDPRKLYPFRGSSIIPYRLKFRTDYITTNLDNNLLFDGLNSFAGTPQNFGYPPPGILVKMNIKDLLEDYQIEGGVRIPTSFNGTEYFLLLDDRKKRLDKRYSFYRRSLRFTGDESPFPSKDENTITLGQIQWRYPLDIFRSFRATTTLRFDRNISLSTDVNSLRTPALTEQRLGGKIEYVFDNTLDVSLNIKNGTRYKIFAEAIKKMDIGLTEGFRFSLNDGFMTVLGFDARHYQRILKHSVLAVRGAAATSFGSEKILYYLGGTDGWLIPKFSNDIPFPTDDNFAYQGLATHLRGFHLNIRNGNSYALTNTELRVPIFRYFSNSIRSGFFRNFQVVGFFDAGTAWSGKTPFATENPLNTVFLPNPPNPTIPVRIKINYFRDPIVMGYGVGARSTILGYFVRLDYAWGLETRVQQAPKWFFSLGMDF